MRERLQCLMRMLVVWELPVVLLVMWTALISIPLLLGEIGISWDALNHHIYLGWTAEHPRFDRDFLAASYQSYQFPYLYWPVYKLAVNGFSGVWAGVALATLHTVVVPPVWMIARTCMPGNQGFDVLMRFLAVILAFMAGVVLSLFDSTSNDLMAAAPFVWAMALALEPLRKRTMAWLTDGQLILLSGLLAGASVAFKLSSGPLVVLLPGLWVLSGATPKSRLFNVCAGCIAALAGFAVIYGYWGWQLWRHFGNPIYPFYDQGFAPLRAALGWHS